MVRTKANINTSVRVSAAKAPRKNVAPSCHSADMGSPSSKKDKSSGGNPVCPRPTPEWQKSIGSFFSAVPRQDKEEENLNKKQDNETPMENSPTHSHDDKENQNPDEDGSSKGSEIPDEEPGPSTSSSTKPNAKKRRILRMVDSDSETEETVEPKANGCVVSMKDEITIC